MKIYKINKNIHLFKQAANLNSQFKIKCFFKL